MRRRTRQLLGSAAALAVPLPGAGVLSSPPSSSNAHIQHVIVVMQSGHSFDNYFGTRPGVDGIPPGVCQPVVPGSSSCVKPYHLSSAEARSGLSDTLRVTQRAIDGGKMDHFVSSQPNSSIGSVAMGYLDRSDLPYYWGLADRFTLFDHFYASSQAGALPNRLFAISGQDDGISSNTAPAGGINVPTVFDQLDAAHLSWKYYIQGYKGSSHVPTAGDIANSPLLAMPSITGTPSRADRIVGTGQYYTDMAKGQLPSVSYVSGTIDSERSPRSPANGEAFVRSLVDALMQSSAWKHTVLLLAYDDSGGWYDHSTPPTQDGVQLGLRVPALLVAPYARSGYVNGNQFDTASIPGLIDQVFRLPAITGQAASAGSILNALDLGQKPISPAIGSDRGAAAVIPRPAVFTIYVLYLVALGVAGLLVALAFRRSRRRNWSSPSSSPVTDPPS